MCNETRKKKGGSDKGKEKREQGGQGGVGQREKPPNEPEKIE